MSNFYQDEPGRDPLYLQGFLWEELLEHTFSSQSFLQYCQDEPPFTPRWNAATQKTEWTGTDTPHEWINNLEWTSIWHREQHDDRALWNWKMPKYLKMLSHVGGYLGDYMMTEYRSRAFRPCHCTFVKNWVYWTLYDELRSAQRLKETTSSLTHDMMTNWGQ